MTVSAPLTSSARPTWERWSPVGGIAFVILAVVGFGLLNGGMPSTDAPARDWISFYSDSGNRAQVLVGAYVMTVAGLAFLWFLAGLRGRLLEVDRGSSALSWLVAGSGLIFVAMLMAGTIAMASVAGSITFGNSPVPPADFGRQLSQLGFGLVLLASAFFAALFVAATSYLALETGAFARWLAIVGFIVAVVLLFSALLIPMIVYLLWVLAVSISLLIRGRSSATAPTS